MDNKIFRVMENFKNPVPRSPKYSKFYNRISPQWKETISIAIATGGLKTGINSGHLTKYVKISLKMRLIFLAVSFCVASTVPLSIPEKLRLYQNATGIDDEKLFHIFKKSKEGKELNYILKY